MDLPTTHYDESFTAPARTAEVKTESTKGSLFSKIAMHLLLIAALLTPLVFIPSPYAPLDVVKAFFLGFIILAAAILYAIDAVKHKTIALPQSVLGYAAVGIVISTILSALASGNITKAFIGQGFEITSASFILLMVLAAYLISRVVIRDRETVLKIYSAIFIAFIILALLHIARIFGGSSFLSLGILSGVTSTIIGKWYDFAALTGAIGILSLIGIKFLPLRTSLRGILYVALLVSGFLLFVVNSSFLWAIVAVVALVLGIFEYSVARKGDAAKGKLSGLSLLTVIVFVIAAGLAWKGNVVALPTVDRFKAQYGELVLPWQMTLDITSNTLKESPILGAGPNRFGLQYLNYKPALINQTPFWNAEFTSGFGLLPSILVTQGILGALVWIVFLAFFIREGIRALGRVTDPLKRFFVSSSFFTALFLWIINLVYVPSHTTIFLTAIFTGIFVALLVSEGIIKERIITVRQGAKSGKLIPVLFYALVIVLAVWLGAYVKKAIAMTHFQKGIKTLSTTRSADVAQSQFKKALSWSTSDIYYQALSETNILKINSLAQEIQNETATGATPDQKKSDQLVALITDSLKFTKNAQQIDSKNYYNYLAEARISEIGTSLKLPNAYENAKNAYANAILANPSNPLLYLNLARLEASQNKLVDAEQYIGRALQLKPNYIEAVFLLSQIQVANNQLKDAMISTQVAIQLNPNEPLLFFQYGLLSYTGKDYTTAITALEKAVSLNGEYANARYFLGLSYARMGRNADAIAQFEELTKTNPDNQEVAFILGNLREGKSPFADAQPPIDSKPEKRTALPVKEKPEPAPAAAKTPTTKR